MMYRYREVIQNYSVAQRVIYPEFTNSWVLRNEGNTFITLDNGETLNPGDSKSIGGNAGEIYDGFININFVVPTPAPAVVTRSAVFTFKYYRSIVLLEKTTTGFTKKEINLTV